MNRNSKTYKCTAILCMLITLTLGVAKASAAGQQVKAASHPAQFTQDECNQLASASASPALANVKCGDNSSDMLLVLLLIVLLCAVAAAASDPGPR
jgi:hypothetical protein